MDLWNISSRAATAGLAGLVILDVVLVGAALRSTHSDGIDVSLGGSASASTKTSTRAAAKPSAKPSVTVTPTAAAPLRTMLVAIDDQRAWRVGAGTCADGGAILTRTVDGGKTWAEGKTLLSRIVRVQPTNGQVAFVVGAVSGCTALLKDTKDGGDTWGSVGTVAGVWFRDPRDATAVGAPGSSTSQPCDKRDVLDLAVLSPTSARVLCVDGLVRQTTDTGSTWTDVGRVTGAVAMAVPLASPAQTFVARAGTTDCAGVQITQVSQQIVTSCVRTVMPKEPGQIAMSLVKGGGWLAVGEKTLRSTDNLVTWNAS